MNTSKNHYNSWGRKILYFFTFLKYGVFINLVTGRLYYLPFYRKCKCSRLQIMRHGKTIGVENKEFMSDTSANSVLSNDGKKEIRKVAYIIEKDIPDIIIVSSINRVKETFMVLKNCLSCNYSVEFSNDMKGINNSVWQGKKFEMLDESNLIVFLERECKHNVFIKTECGDSWADVIFRCTKVLNRINKYYSNKKVLLISQGSIYQSLKILLHIENSPWDNYSALKMFNINDVSSKDAIGYSCLFNFQ